MKLSKQASKYNRQYALEALREFRKFRNVKGLEHYAGVRYGCYLGVVFASI